MRLFRSLRANIATALVALLAIGFVAPLPSLAASASPASYHVTRHAISVAADHEIRFVTPTGVDASTDTITLSGYTGFGFGSVSFADIDLFHGPVTGLETSETLAAAPGIGVWGVSIAGTTITFTAPTDAVLGEIASGDTVTIRIGLNAAGGVNQITNPASPGLAQILLGGTFGDTILMGFPIMTNDSVTVTATVGSATSSPPNPGGGGDTTAPIISNVQVINVSTSSATIVWDTNESSNSAVDYGLTTAYASGTVSDPGFVTSHSITLTNLSPGTIYHFQVSSSDAAANRATAGDFTFTTLGGQVPPVISNVQVVDITDTSARVTWTTNTLTDSTVYYGTSTGYGFSVSDPGFVTSHSILLTGLTPSTVYHFLVQSTDQSGNTAITSDAAFMTTADTTPPANVSAFTAVGGDAVVHLSWNPPPDPDYAGVRIVRSESGYPSGPFDGVLIYIGNGTAFDDTQVVNGVTYFYGAFAFDTHGNYASGALAQATPMGPPAPPTPENTNATCSNGMDDDADGLIDCADPSCQALAICHPPVPSPENTNPTCSNGSDDDADGLIDCADPSCSQTSVCQVPQIPPNKPPVAPQPTPNGQIITITPHFFGSQGTVELVPDAQGAFGAPANSAVFVTIPVVGLSATPNHAYVVVGSSTYNLALNGNGTAYSGTFAVPAGVSQVPVVVSMTFVGGGAAVSSYILVVQPGGQVVEQGLFGNTTIGVPGATVTLYVNQNGTWTLWNGAPYGQSNPTITSADGGFIFEVPNGEYFASAAKDGYIAASSPAQSVTKNVFGVTIAIIKIPVVPPLVVSSTSTLIGNIVDFVQNVLQQIAFVVMLIRAFLQQPAAKQFVETQGLPLLTIVSLLNLAAALPAFNIFAYLQYLFTQPILAFWRRKRQKYGLIYNSLTKQPVDLAIVRLQDAHTHATLQTRVTDRSGRFAFIIRPGSYLLDVVKPGYAFPTQLLKDQRADVDYLDLYHGLVINADKNDAVAVNIPIDPVVTSEQSWQLILRKFLRKAQENIAFISIILSIVALLIAPTVAVGLMALVQVGVYVLFRRLSVSSKVKSWGIVYDAKTHLPVERAIVRIFDKKFNKLLETQITGPNGRYGFFVRRNVFYVTAEREGYVRHVSPDIDLSSKDEAIVDQNISLEAKA